jgi:hypothetical protein
VAALKVGGLEGPTAEAPGAAPPDRSDIHHV